ncbi:ABC transporter permease [Labrys wisconsinensis]|uniref:Spermidine/putrescine transport system permease protein n=1 Tax=Labrys wisconsinensis TaxID=425677 RepID=A0ABU0J4F4_9HYPH|nr:ABC transporter permease [Labrys wisconsinensis]MDQ0469143.1 spermidine/putrescine transport system permease protein [Labrys wisconsinensis]
MRNTLGLPARGLRAHLWLVYAFLYGPIAVVVLLSFNEAGLPTVWSGFSTRWYAALAASPKILHAGWNSLVVAVCVTAIATVLGTLLAFAVEARGRRRGAGLLDAVLTMPLIIPDIVLAIALLSFFTALQMTLGLYSIVLSHVTFDVAYVCMMVRTRLKHFDFALVEASADLGASGPRTFFKVVLPSILPGVVAAALLAFTLSVDEFIIAYFTAGAGAASTTLPMQIYAMIRFGVTPEINALATLTLLVTCTLLFAAQRLSPNEEVRS